MRSVVRVPIEDVVEQFLRVATFLFPFPSPITLQRRQISRTRTELAKKPLLLATLPGDGFVESRASGEAGLLLSTFPRLIFLQNKSFGANKLLLR